MNALHDYALLFSVAVPVLAIAGLNVFLFLGEERGTLLIPSGRPFEVPEYAFRPVEPTSVPAPGRPAANDELQRRAA